MLMVVGLPENIYDKSHIW